MILRPRALVVAGSLVAIICLALVVAARKAAPMTPTSDTAVIELDTLLASRGQLLVGPYSRFQWHHPGPLYFIWMAPFYFLSGTRTAGLNAGALALNLLALATIVAVATRRAGGLTALAIAAATGVFAWRAGAVLTSPWNPHIPVFPLIALIVVAADAMSGTPGMLPVVAAFASIVGQTHVGVLPSAFVLGTAALMGVVVQRRTTEVRAFRRTVVITAIVVLVLWMPPLIDQIVGRPGNLTELWRFFVTEPHRGQPISVAVSAWSDMLSGVVRPDFYVAQGWPFRESPVGWAEALSIVQLAGLIATAAFAFRAQQRFVLALACLLVVTSLLALWAATRIEGAIFDHEVFWIAGVGALNLSLLPALVSARLSNKVPETSSTRTLMAAACWLIVSLSAIAGVRHFREAVVHSANPGIESETARIVADDLGSYLTREGLVRPLVRIDQDAWGMAAGVILKLYKDGIPVAVEDDWLVMFAPAFKAGGRESTVITIAGKAQHVRMEGTPGDELIITRDPLFVHRSR